MGDALKPLEFLRNMIVSGNPQNGVLAEAVRKACASLPDASLQAALSEAAGEIIAGRQLGQDVFSARANTLAVLDRIEKTAAPDERTSG
jgi:hypothetical protein